MRVDLIKENADTYSFLMRQNLVIKYNGSRFLGKKEFFKMAGLSASDISGLVKLLEKGARSLFGAKSSAHVCFDKMNSVPVKVLENVDNSVVTLDFKTYESDTHIC